MSCHTLSPTFKTKASGCQRPSKPWCFVPVCQHGHGGCDDNNGDTRLARGLPFGSMPSGLPRTRGFRDRHEGGGRDGTCSRSSRYSPTPQASLRSGALSAVSADASQWVSGSSETKTYSKSATVREHDEEPTLPRRPFFGKDGDERSRVFRALHVLVSPAYALFSGKMSYTAIARRCRASS